MNIYMKVSYPKFKNALGLATWSDVQWSQHGLMHDGQLPWTDVWCMTVSSLNWFKWSAAYVTTCCSASCPGWIIMVTFLAQLKPYNQWIHNNKHDGQQHELMHDEQLSQLCMMISCPSYEWWSAVPVIHDYQLSQLCMVISCPSYTWLSAVPVMHGVSCPSYAWLSAVPVMHDYQLSQLCMIIGCPSHTWWSDIPVMHDYQLSPLCMMIKFPSYAW